MKGFGKGALYVSEHILLIYASVLFEQKMVKIITQFSYRCFSLVNQVK